jgi:hypothetical protein
MNAVDKTKAGAASGVLSMSRMVGSTFGVAVMGAIVTTVGKSQIEQNLPHLPAAERSAIANALGSGASAAAHAPQEVVRVVQNAFVTAVSTGLTVGVVFVLVGAVTAWLLVQRGPRPAHAQATQAEDTAEPVGVDLAA